MWKFTFSLLLLSLSFLAISQDQKEESSTILLEEEEKDFRPSMLKLSYDIIVLGETILNDARIGQHFQAVIDFHNYYLVGEYGFQNSNRSGEFVYENSGSYFRLGPEVNLLKNSEENSMTFGLKYAHSSFSDNITFTKTSNAFGDTDISVGNPDAKANWLEVTAGLNVNVWKGLYMGYVVRYQIFRSLKNTDDLVPYDIPGFGLQQNKQGVGFSYFIGWAIPLREKEIIPEDGL